MLSKSFKVTFIGCLLACSAFTTQATSINIEVDSQSRPWDTNINSSFNYGTGGSIDPTVVDGSNGFDFSVGANPFKISFVTGGVQGYREFPIVDADGMDADSPKPFLTNGNPGNSGNFFPSKHMPGDWDTYLMALVGTFANDAGEIQGTPFEIGRGPFTILAPLGATRLQLGINDDIFSDNTGLFLVNIEQSAVPIPAAIWLFISGLVGLVSIRRK